MLCRLMGFNYTFSPYYSTKDKADDAFIVCHSSVTTCDSCVFSYIPLLDLVWTFFFIGGDSWDGRVQGNCFCEIDF